MFKVVADKIEITESQVGAGSGVVSREHEYFVCHHAKASCRSRLLIKFRR
jgi:hypothetical protein